MFYQLTKKQEQLLLSRPEKGMGYQVIPELKPTNAVSKLKTEFPDGGEIFVPQSVYENDKRVDPINIQLAPLAYLLTFA